MSIGCRVCGRVSLSEDHDLCAACIRLRQEKRLPMRLMHNPDNGCWGCVFCYDQISCRLGENGPRATGGRSLLESQWHTDHIGVSAPEWCPLRRGPVTVEGKSMP